MGLEILIEELAGGIWVAALKDGRLDGLEMDPPAEEVRWGSIYWAKVARVDKAQDAVFVNLDGDNIGILYNADVRIQQKDGRYKKGGDVAIGKSLEPGQMIAVQAKSAYLPNADEPYAKANSKSPRVSMNITLPGRYLIHAPMEGENRVSQRIRDKNLRKQIMSMLDSMNDCKGCILRAAAANTQTDILAREARILSAAWSQMQEYLEGDKPQLIMLGPDAIQRTLSDHANQTIDRIELTTMDHYQQAEEWCDIYAPDLVTKILPVEIEGATEDLSLFDHRDIIGQVEALFHPYVILGSGATVLLQETAALTAIDINSAADERGHLEINRDAADEIARQLRLRNIGGIIVIDFLKMKSEADRKDVKDVLEEAFNTDPCTVQIHGWTNLGLMEVVRNRRTPPLLDRYESFLGEEDQF